MCIVYRLFLESYNGSWWREIFRGENLEQCREFVEEEEKKNMGEEVEIVFTQIAEYIWRYFSPTMKWYVYRVESENSTTGAVRQSFRGAYIG